LKALFEEGNFSGELCMVEKWGKNFVFGEISLGIRSVT
jgi:hypothetical protein